VRPIAFRKPTRLAGRSLAYVAVGSRPSGIWPTEALLHDIYGPSMRQVAGRWIEVFVRLRLTPIGAIHICEATSKMHGSGLLLAHPKFLTPASRWGGPTLPWTDRLFGSDLHRGGEPYILHCLSPRSHFA
jgi:hypothetical protein